MTEQVLNVLGKDLVTPRPEYRFKVLKHGDKWCLCALRWINFNQGTKDHWRETPKVGANLKHSVLMAGLGWDNLQNVPVFNDFSEFIEAEDVDAGPVLVRVSGPNLMTMKYHQIALCH